MARARHRLGQASLGTALVAVILANPEPLWVVAGLFVLVVPFEKLFPRHRQPLRRPGLGTDLAYALAQPVLTAAGLALGVVIGLVSLAWLPGLALRPLVTAVAPGPRLLLGVLMFDAAFYWVHRWSHQVPYLWRFHAIHHSTRHLDWISGLRSHPFDGALLGVPVAFLLGAGFPPETAGVLTALQLAFGLFIHANVRWRWRALQRVVHTPEMHHWHHADEPAAHNRNFAALLPLWDQLFGTFYVPGDRRPRSYGVSEPVPEGFLAQLWRPLQGHPSLRWIAFRPLRALRRLGAALARGVYQLRNATTLRPRPTRVPS